MSGELQTAYGTFHSLIHSLFEELDSTELLYKLRLKAWEHFLNLGLPLSRDSESFRYVKLRHFYSKQYAYATPLSLTKEAISAYVYPECQESVIVFENGLYNPLLSNMNGMSKKIVVNSLPEAYRTYSSFLNNQWAQSLKDEKDPFAALNGALHHSGVFIYIPPKTLVERPIQILNVVDTGEMTMIVMPRLHLFVGAQSEVEILSSQAILSGEDVCINMCADFSIEENSHVKYNQIPYGDKEGMWVFDSLHAHLKRNSKLQVICVNEGSAGVRHDYRVTLAGENADALLNGVWMLKGKREAHGHILMEHQAPHCHSLQRYKSVLNDFSRSNFEGKILVRQAAQKTDAFQLNNNLLLNDHALAYSKPNLEIFADDVKASHGATFGQLDPEQLFVLRSRGIEEKEAVNLLVYGFCKEVIDLVTIPSLHLELSLRAKAYLTQRLFQKEKENSTPRDNFESLQD